MKPEQNHGQVRLQLTVMGATYAEVAELQAALSGEHEVLSVQRVLPAEAQPGPIELQANAVHEAFTLVLVFMGSVGSELAKDAAKELGKQAFSAAKNAIAAHVEEWKAAKLEGEDHGRIQFQLAEDGDLLISPRRPKP